MPDEDQGFLIPAPNYKSSPLSPRPKPYYVGGIYDHGCWEGDSYHESSGLKGFGLPRDWFGILGRLLGYLIFCLMGLIRDPIY